MREITINLTEQQEHFLKIFSANHFSGSKDNVGTEKPIHFVQTRRSRVVDPDFDSADETMYYMTDYADEGYGSVEELVRAKYEDEDCPIDIVSYDDAYADNDFKDINGEEFCVIEEEDYLEAYGIEKKDYYKVHVSYYYDTVAVFFILSEAKEYMKYQGHNLENPRTYTVGAGYANKGEYHHFWDLLFSIGKMIGDADE